MDWAPFYKESPSIIENAEMLFSFGFPPTHKAFKLANKENINSNSNKRKQS